MPIIYNQFKGQKAVVNVTGGALSNTETYQLSGFSQTQNETFGSANTNTTDNISALSISKIIYTGNVAVSRGANVIFQSEAGTSGIWNLDTFGILYNQYPTANLTITTGTYSTAIVEVKKSFNAANTVY